MFSTLLNVIKTPSQRTSLECDDTPKSPLSQAIHGLDSLHLTDDLSIPGSFSPGLSMDIQRTSNQHRMSSPPTENNAARISSPLSPIIRGLDSLHLNEAISGSSLAGLATESSKTVLNAPSSSTLDSLETLLTAATLTSSPLDTSNHEKLFSSSSQFYDHRASTVPDSLRSLDMTSAMQGLAAVANSKTPTCPPARRPGRQFGRMQNPVYSQLSQRRNSRSPPPTPSGSGARKVVNDELKELDQLSDKLLHHRAEVLNDTFDSLPADSQCEKLENADAFVKSGLARIAHFEGKRKARAKMAAYRRNEVRADSNDTTMQEKRDSIVQSLKALHVEICALYAPLLAERPLVIDA
ncbi:hypothetical protein BT96DRAFT_951388, partial [Gymnopus androsaceus JB14]